MENFVLHTPTKILFGQDQIASLRDEILPQARVLDHLRRRQH